MDVMLDDSIVDPPESDDDDDNADVVRDAASITERTFKNAHELLRQLYATSNEMDDNWQSRRLDKVSEVNKIAWCESAMHVTYLASLVERWISTAVLDEADKVAHEMKLDV